MENAMRTASARSDFVRAKAERVHSLVSLADFKAVLGIDDRDDALSRFALATATYSIERYCRRVLFKKRVAEYLEFTGEYVFPLREYPVRRVHDVFCATGSLPEFEGRVPPDLYRYIPDCGIEEDLPSCLYLRGDAGVRSRTRFGGSIRVRYSAGFGAGEAPSDLEGACVELAAWNMSRFRGKSGGFSLGGSDGAGLEMGVPENVRGLLEPYRRRTI
jgi:hypothetical protein